MKTLSLYAVLVKSHLDIDKETMSAIVSVP